MANVFYININDDVIAAYEILGGTGTPSVVHTGAAGWYSVATGAGTIATTRVTPGDASLNEADKVYLLAPAAGSTHAFSAGGGRDEYIITTAFAEAAAADANTAVTINDTAQNVFTFEAGVQISSINVTDGGTLEISFGQTTHKAFLIENAANAVFKFGTNGDEKTWGEFQTLVGTPSTSAPHTVALVASLAFATDTLTTATLDDDAAGRGDKDPIILGTVKAAASDGGTVTYFLDSVLDGIGHPLDRGDHGFVVDRNTGVVTYEGSGLNYEYEEQREHTLIISATAVIGGTNKTARHEITVTVTDVEDPDIFTSDSAREHVRTPRTAFIEEGVDGSDAPVTITTVTGNPYYVGGAAGYTYSLAVMAGNAPPPADNFGFVIDPATGEITYTGTGLSRSDHPQYTLIVIATANKDNGPEIATHRVTLNVTEENVTDPEADPDLQTTDEEVNIVFTREDFGFSDADAGTELVSITITSQPFSHRPEGQPRYVDQGALFFNHRPLLPSQTDIMVSVDDIDKGNLYYRPGNQKADYQAKFTYTVSDGKRDSAPATMLIDVEADDDAPDGLIIDENIAVNRGEGFVLNGRYARRFNKNRDAKDDNFSSWWQLRGLDRDSFATELFYTLNKIAYTTANAEVPAPQLQRRDADGNWVDLAVDDTFTQEEVNSGRVRLLAHDDGSFEVSLSDSVNKNVIPKTLGFKVREVIEAEGTELGGAGPIDNSDEDAPKSIETGLGKSKIKPGTGDDVVDPGLGDDTVDLGAGGTDAVIYRFRISDGNIIAWGGGDRITGFTPGEDQLLIGAIGRDSGPDDASRSFLDGLGRGFTVTLTTEYTGGDGGDRGSLVYYSVTGIEIHFAEAVLLPGGVLGGSILTITFNAPIAWADSGTPGEDDYTPGFKTTWLTDGAFDEQTLSFNNDAKGKGALVELLGLDGVGGGADDLRSVAVGNGDANVIDLANDVTPEDQQGAWVVFGDGGDDTITLGQGTEEVVYRLGVDDENTITLSDGSDEVNKFDLGTDSLTLVDTDVGTDGTPAALADVLGGLAASLDVDDDGDYAGISLGLGNDGDALQITFADPLTEDELGTRLGEEVTVADFFDGTTPSAGAPATVASTELDHIADLFGVNDDGDALISVVDTLPPELL